MSRPLRLEFPGAWYHVMNRGGGYRSIYQTKQTRQLFLDLLEEAWELYAIQVHSYCLMDNHYHLLVNTPRGNLSRAMRHINGVYTQRYNRLQKTDGPLFRGRYKGIIVQDDTYLLQVSRYIHLNPVEAGLVKNPLNYSWSSFRYYTDEHVPPNWLYTDFILNMLGKRNKYQRYAAFVEEGIDKETKKHYEQKKISVVMGDRDFKEKLLSSLSKEKILASRPDYIKTRYYPSKEEILKAITNFFKIDLASLKISRRGRMNKAKCLAIYACKNLADMKISEIAKEFNLKSHGSISKIASETKQYIQNDSEFKKAYQFLVKCLK